MSCKRDLPLLYRSLCFLFKNYKFVNMSDVIVLHDDITKSDIANLQVSLHQTIGYIPKIKFETLEFLCPQNLQFEEKYYKVSLNEFWMGYRHMCRYHSGLLYKDDRFKNYDYYLRLDSDSYIYSEINWNIFEYMENNNFSYAYMKDEDREVPRVAEDLWEETKSFIDSNKNLVLHSFYERLVDNKWDYTLYYTNFEIAKFDFFRSNSYMSYFEHLDKTNKFFYNRWGDAPIHWLGVNMFLEPSKILKVDNICYQHNNWIKNLSSLKNKKIEKWAYDLIDGHENAKGSRKHRFVYAMNRYYQTGIDGVNWGD